MNLFFALFDTIAITGGMVNTMEPGAKPAVMTILIENDRIVAVAPDVEIPPTAKRVDAKGQFVIPGLIDGYVNLDPDHDRLYVSNGVTLVRDAGNDMTRIVAETDRTARERSPGPWIWCAGAVLDGSPPSTRTAVLLDTQASAEDKIPRVLENAAIDYLSFHTNLAKDPWKKTLELAHAQHKQVWGPLAKGVTFDEMLAAGQDGIYHLDAFLPSGVTWETLTPEMIGSIAKKAGAQKLRVTPTLAVYANRFIARNEDAPDLALLGPFYCETWLNDIRVRKEKWTLEYLNAGKLLVEKQAQLLAALYKEGCRLVPGSGTPNAWLFPGTALLDELSLWRKAGIPTSELVQLATAGAADALGAEKRGSIRAGKVADLVITDHDPLLDLANLYKPAKVVLRGRVLERKELDGLLKALQATQQRVKDTLAKPLEVAEPAIPTGDVVLTGAVETKSIGTRVSAERYAVVRRYDGSLTYCGRVVVPGEATTFSTETTVQQTIQNGNLIEFDVTMTSGPRALSVHGELVGGKFSIETRDHGQFVGTNEVNDKLAFVDCGSVTSLLVLGYHRSPGSFKVFFFDDYDPAKGTWEMRLDKDALHLVHTPLGELRVAYDAIGGIVESKRQVGNGILQTLSLASKAVDGKGLPMPASKRAQAPSAKQDVVAPVPKELPK